MAMSLFAAGDDPYEDEEEEQENDDLSMEGDGRREIVVFVVDASKDMFLELETKKGEVKTYFEAVLECITEDLKNRIISRDNDEVAILFYNTREKKNTISAEGVYTFKETSKLSASFIKDVSSLDSETFENDIGTHDGTRYTLKENTFFSAVWAAQGMMSKSNVIKRILLSTNNDDPFGLADAISKADMKRTTTQRCKDLQDLGISIELFPMSRPREEFNVSIFYKDVLQMDDEEVASFMVGAENKFEQLMARMKKRLFQKRVVRKMTLTIGRDTHIGVGTYAMIRPAVPGKYVWLDSATNKPLKSERALICADTGAVITEPQKRYTEYSNKRLILSSGELVQIKKVSYTQLQLLGFKSLECLKDYHNLRPATFLYPSEESIRGSTCLFIALHKAMVQLNRFALAFHGNTTSPHLVALVAQEEIVNEYGQVQPPGMHMIYLPYADDIRQIEKMNNSKEPTIRATSEQIDKASTVLKKLHLKDFTVYDIQNPALQKHYANLQALGLDEDTAEEIQDYTLPDEEGMKRPSVVGAVQAFKDAVYGPEHDAEEAAAEAERAKGSVTVQKRKAAAEAASKEVENYDWRELALSGKLKDLTVVQLKYYLVDKKLPVSGKKEVLLDRIIADLGL